MISTSGFCLIVDASETAGVDFLLFVIVLSCSSHCFASALRAEFGGNFLFDLTASPSVSVWAKNPESATKSTVEVIPADA